MKFEKKQMDDLASKSGFIRDNLEKVLRLVEILKFVYNDELLKKYLCLKGGTAINLVALKLPRISTDLDFDIALNISKDELDIIKPTISEKIIKYLEENGYTMSKEQRESHALTSYRFSYINNATNKDVIKIDISFIDRAHIFKLKQSKIRPSYLYDSFKILTPNIIELYAAKLDALISRGTARDLYDVNKLIDNNLITDLDSLRKSLIFYDAISGNQMIDDLSLLKIDEINHYKFRTTLKPYLTKRDRFDIDEGKIKAKKFVTSLLSKTTKKEKEFVKEFRLGNYQPTLLFDDPKIIANIQNHPMALWRCRDKKTYQ